jgi:GxxExxY protein
MENSIITTDLRNGEENPKPLITKKLLNDLTFLIIGNAIQTQKLHKQSINMWLNNNVLANELRLYGINFNTDLQFYENYDDEGTICTSCLTILVSNMIIVEMINSMTCIETIERNLTSKLKKYDFPRGIILNFTETNIFRNGHKVVENPYFKKIPSI